MAASAGSFTAKVNKSKGSETRIYEATVDAAYGGDLIVIDTGTNGTGPKQVVFTSARVDNYKRILTPYAKTLDPNTQKSLLTSVADQADTHRVNYLKTAAVSHLEDYKDVPGIKNVETKPPDQTVPTNEDPNNPLTSSQLPGIDKEKRAEINEDGIPLKTSSTLPLPKGSTLFYPEALVTNKYQQDYIQFEVKTYKSRVFNTEGLYRSERYKSEKQKKLNFVECTICLPIQGGISDSNSVNWGPESLNAIQQAQSYASLSAMSGDPMKSGDEMIKSVSNLVEDPSTNRGLQQLFQSLMAKAAIGSENNFFSRAFGAVLNPNMELLFQTVELRPFTFRFDLTPRSETEALIVKKIIRIFKQSMAARQGVADIFLATPMVYDIKYIKAGGKNETHPSINKIKTCALKSFNVNYTPNNQYMTYDDEAATMAAYSLDMTFQELEPVYFDDYDEFPDAAVIGY